MVSSLCSSSKLSNGETESVKTMIVHDETESDPATTPCKDGTLIVRQVTARVLVICPYKFNVLLFQFYVHQSCSFCHFKSFIPFCLISFVCLSHCCFVLTLLLNQFLL